MRDVIICVLSLITLYLILAMRFNSNQKIAVKKEEVKIEFIKEDLACFYQGNKLINCASYTNWSEK